MVWQRSCLLATWMCFGAAGLLVAQDDAPVAEAAGEAAPAEVAPAEQAQDEAAIAPFDGDPNNPDDLEKWVGPQFQKIVGALQSDPDLAETQADALAAAVAGLKIEDPKSKRLVDQVNNALDRVHERAALSRITIEELQQKLEASPDEKTVRQYVAKVTQSLQALTDSDPSAAEKQLADVRAYLAALAAKSTSDEVKQAVERAQRPLAGVERSIESQKRLTELIGQDAAPLDIPVWVNGGPLNGDKLKGKVVLLDFWAVWCGPCIMTFPHLREWHDEYHDKGFEIVGVTGYYNFKWDEAAGKAVSAKGEVSHEDEQAMLVKFAEQHKLAHPFAVNEDGSLSKFYGVAGIPHVVLIDRAGKIRLIKVGAGESNAKEISAMIEKLIAE